MSDALRNLWKPTSRTHSPAVLGQSIDEPCAWTRGDLVKSQAYLYCLSNAEAADILDAVDRVEDRGMDIKDITRQEFDLPVFGPVLEDLREEESRDDKYRSQLSERCFASSVGFLSRPPRPND